MKSLRYLLCLAALLGVSYSGAQGIFSIEEQFRSVQSTGLGGVSNVNGANAFSVYENSSSAALSEKKFELGLQYSPWAKNLTKGMDRDNLMMNAAGYYSINDNNKILAGFSYYAPGGNKMYMVDENGNILGDEIRTKYFSFNIGYAYRINNNLGVSAGVSYANWNDGFNGNSNMVAFDLGVTDRIMFKSGNRFIDIAFRMNGWGITTGLEGYKTPGFVSIGGMYNSRLAEKHLVRVGSMLEYRCLDETGFRASFGGEYGFNDILFLRAGYNFVNDYNKQNGFTSLGVGTRILDKVQIDFAYLMANKESQLKNTYMIGASILF